MMFRNGRINVLEPETRFTEDNQERLVERHFRPNTYVVEYDGVRILGKPILRLQKKDYRALRKIERDFLDLETPIEKRYSRVCALTLLFSLSWIFAAYYFFGPPRIMGDYLIFLIKTFSNLILPIGLAVKQINRAFWKREQGIADLAKLKSAAQQRILDCAESGVKACDINRYQILPIILGPQRY